MLGRQNKRGREQEREREGKDGRRERQRQRVRNGQMFSTATWYQRLGF